MSVSGKEQQSLASMSHPAVSVRRVIFLFSVGIQMGC